MLKITTERPSLLVVQEVESSRTRDTCFLREIQCGHQFIADFQADSFYRIGRNLETAHTFHDQRGSLKNRDLATESRSLCMRAKLYLIEVRRRIPQPNALIVCSHFRCLPQQGFNYFIDRTAYACMRLTPEPEDFYTYSSQTTQLATKYSVSTIDIFLQNWALAIHDMHPTQTR